MPRAVEARAWWAEVEDVRERIELRRERERSRALGRPGAVGVPAMRRGVREVRTAKRLMLVDNGLPKAHEQRPRPRARPIERVGPHPDRIAAWAVALGFLLVLAALLSTHG
jgi:hypothetical protein